MICRLETEKEELVNQLGQNQAKFDEIKQAYEEQARQMAAGMASFQPEESKQAESTSAIPTSLSPGLIA